MPFITEEIYSNLITEDESIMISEWPKALSGNYFPEAEKSMGLIMNAIRSIRNVRAEMNVPASKKANVIFVTENDEYKDILIDAERFFIRLVSAQNIEVRQNKENLPSNAVSAVINGIEIFMPLEDLIDIDREIERLEKEKVNLEQELERVNNKLNNEKFISKAPESIVKTENEKKQKYTDMYDKVIERIQSLKN